MSGKLPHTHREPTRRGFLGAAATTAWLASQAKADDLDPVRILVIGTGGRGCDLIRALTTIEGAEIVGVCDDYEPHRTQGARYAGPQAAAFANHHEALEKTQPQAVVIAVPLVSHFPIAMDALDAGAAVFCEKTMCYRIDEARTLAKRVAELNRVFQVGLQRRAHPIYQQAAAMVQSGMIGQITAIQAQWHRNNNWRRPVPVPKSDMKWAQLERRLNWRLYRESSDGLMSELGSHQMDVANWFLGTMPRKVVASAGIDYWRDGREVFDNIFCVYDYETTPTTGPSKAPYRVRVTYSSLCNNAYEGASELILGTRGTLYLTTSKGLLYRETGADAVTWTAAAQSEVRAEGDASLITAGKTLKLSDSPWAHRGAPIEIDNLSGDETRAELVSFLDHVRRNDTKTLVDATAGLRNTATVLIANEAADTGRPVDFPDDLS